MTETGGLPSVESAESLKPHPSMEAVRARFLAQKILGQDVYDSKKTSFSLNTEQVKDIVSSPTLPLTDITTASHAERIETWGDTSFDSAYQSWSKSMVAQANGDTDRLGFLSTFLEKSAPQQGEKTEITQDDINKLYDSYAGGPEQVDAFVKQMQRLCTDSDGAISHTLFDKNRDAISWLSRKIYGFDTVGKVLTECIDGIISASDEATRPQLEKDLQQEGDVKARLNTPKEEEVIVLDEFSRLLNLAKTPSLPIEKPEPTTPPPTEPPPAPSEIETGTETSSESPSPEPSPTEGETATGTPKPEPTLEITPTPGTASGNEPIPVEPQETTEELIAQRDKIKAAMDRFKALRDKPSDRDGIIANARAEQEAEVARINAELAKRQRGVPVEPPAEPKPTSPPPAKPEDELPAFLRRSDPASGPFHSYQRSELPETAEALRKLQNSPIKPPSITPRTLRETAEEQRDRIAQELKEIAKQIPQTLFEDPKNYDSRIVASALQSALDKFPFILSQTKSQIASIIASELQTTFVADPNRNEAEKYTKAMGQIIPLVISNMDTVLGLPPITVDHRLYSMVQKKREELTRHNRLNIPRSREEDIAYDGIAVLMIRGATFKPDEERVLMYVLRSILPRLPAYAKSPT